MLLMALRQVAKAHGMAGVARRADVGDSTFICALSESGKPTVDPLSNIQHAMGLRLSVPPLETHA
ncbi:helix-turn-helix domain-containing transcriptional regulator [Limnohabitans sp.]